ncbi:MAG: FMN-binding protein [Gammaproteobacteria bacterium]|jgi:Na+-translocating ferredoxin:NAD+ oxidoreductase subunit G
MSESEMHQPLGTTPAFSMLRTLGLVATISGLLVVLSYRITEPMIEQNKQAAIERALFKVIPGAVARKDFVVVDDDIEPAGEGVAGTPLYAGYDAEGKLMGVAMEAAAAGYADVIRTLYGYDPYCQCIRGFEVLKMAETPGIGDKIVKDAAFLENFRALEAKPNATGDGLENPIVLVKTGEKNNPWEVDAITGATISSKAVVRMLNETSQAMAPIIIRNLSILEGQ